MYTYMFDLAKGQASAAAGCQFTLPADDSASSALVLLTPACVPPAPCPVLCLTAAGHHHSHGPVPGVCLWDVVLLL